MTELEQLVLVREPSDVGMQSRGIFGRDTDPEMHSFVCDPEDEDSIARRGQGALAVASEMLDAMFDGEGEGDARGSR
jgi:hypothetical protein